MNRIQGMSTAGNTPSHPGLSIYTLAAINASRPGERARGYCALMSAQDRRFLAKYIEGRGSYVPHGV